MKKPTPNYFVLRLKINNHNSPFFGRGICCLRMKPDLGACTETKRCEAYFLQMSLQAKTSHKQIN